MKYTFSISEKGAGEFKELLINFMGLSSDVLYINSKPKNLVVSLFGNREAAFDEFIFMKELSESNGYSFDESESTGRKEIKTYYYFIKEISQK